MTGNAAHWFVDRHIAEGRGAKRLLTGGSPLPSPSSDECDT